MMETRKQVEAAKIALQPMMDQRFMSASALPYTDSHGDISYADGLYLDSFARLLNFRDHAQLFARANRRSSCQ